MLRCIYRGSSPLLRAPTAAFDPPSPDAGVDASPFSFTLTDPPDSGAAAGSDSFSLTTFATFAPDRGCLAAAVAPEDAPALFAAARSVCRAALPDAVEEALPVGCTAGF
jgi:hypothetical protein